jgi:hypothetical protein
MVCSYCHDFVADRSWKRRKSETAVIVSTLNSCFYYYSGITTPQTPPSIVSTQLTMSTNHSQFNSGATENGETPTVKSSTDSPGAVATCSSPASNGNSSDARQQGEEISVCWETLETSLECQPELLHIMQCDIKTIYFPPPFPDCLL